jgi:hypothetical protein
MQQWLMQQWLMQQWLMQQAREYSLDKEQASYSDILDALRLSLKGLYFDLELW